MACKNKRISYKLPVCRSSKTGRFTSRRKGRGVSCSTVSVGPYDRKLCRRKRDGRFSKR